MKFTDAESKHKPEIAIEKRRKIGPSVGLLNSNGRKDFSWATSTTPLPPVVAKNL